MASFFVLRVRAQAYYNKVIFQAAVWSNPSGECMQTLSDITKQADNILFDAPIEHLRSFKYQARIHFNKESLQELADSIGVIGVAQPLVARRIPAALSPPFYEIIAGERRWRAAQLAGLYEVPIILRVLSDEEACTVNLIENIQRKNLSPVEEARGLQRMLKGFNLSLKAVAARVGRDPSTVSHLVRLLTLEAKVIDYVDTGELDVGHGKALLRLQGKTQMRAADHILIKGMSVRQAEAHVKTLLCSPKVLRNKAVLDPDIKRLNEQLSARLGSPTSVETLKGGAIQFIIHAFNSEIAEGIIEDLLKSVRD